MLERTVQKVRRESKTKKKIGFNKEKKQDFVHIERISSPLGEFVVLYSSQIPNFARATEKASVPHVAKIMTEFLELKFQVVVSSHRDGGNQIVFSARAAIALHHGAISPEPQRLTFKSGKLISIQFLTLKKF